MRPTPNPLCIEHDCEDCHGLGVVRLFTGNPLNTVDITCPGHSALKHLTKECRENDMDIHIRFMQGYTIPQIHDEMYLYCSIQTLQRYISMRRKLEPTRWPLRRPVGYHVVGYYIDKDAEDKQNPAAADVFVALQEGLSWSAYSPVGQHQNTSAAYVLECQPITMDQYIKYSAGFYTPDEYMILGEAKGKCDCCGKMFPTNQLQLVNVPAKEFDGAACESCETALHKPPVIHNSPFVLGMTRSRGGSF